MSFFKKKNQNKTKVDSILLKSIKSRMNDAQSKLDGSIPLEQNEQALLIVFMKNFITELLIMDDIDSEELKKVEKKLKKFGDKDSALSCSFLQGELSGRDKIKELFMSIIEDMKLETYPLSRHVSDGESLTYKHLN